MRSPCQTPSGSAAPTPPSSSASIGAKPEPADPAVVELGQRIGHAFQHRALVEQALTHASFAHEHPPIQDNEALALLGDAALSLVVAEHLLETLPTATAGELTRERAELVSGANLARWAAHIELGEALRLGRGEEQTGGRARESVLATALEAVLGVVYREGGVAAVRRVVGALALW